MANILIVDDDLEIAEAVAEMLTSAGHETRTARDGVEGLREVAEELPDLIILDVEMPVLDGPGMAEALALQHAEQTPIAIVLISADRQIEKIAGSMGAPHYLRKPFGIALLIDIVSRALAAR